MNVKPLDVIKLNEALNLLNEQLMLRNAPQTNLVVCGGSALLAVGLMKRTTRDVDILAMIHNGLLVDAEPLPQYLIESACNVGYALGLPADWLNNGPASQFRMGLPDGFQERLQVIKVGEKLVMYYIDRIDQIFFKTYASADRGGYHISDLKALHPNDNELINAAKWCMTQDVSDTFRLILKDMFKYLGWDNVSRKI